MTRIQKKKAKVARRENGRLRSLCLTKDEAKARHARVSRVK